MIICKRLQHLEIFLKTRLAVFTIIGFPRVPLLSVCLSASQPPDHVVLFNHKYFVSGDFLSRMHATSCISHMTVRTCLYGAATYFYNMMAYIYYVILSFLLSKIGPSDLVLISRVGFKNHWDLL